MPRTKDCPNCGAEMSYQEEDPDTGINACWFCDECDQVVSDYRDDEEDDY